jgi:hypothetical protein
MMKVEEIFEDISKAKTIYVEEGLKKLLIEGKEKYINNILNYRRYITNGLFVKEFIPTKIGVFNGIYVNNVAFFEPRLQDKNYEEHLVYPLRLLINPSDDVIMIGGGMGVSTVIAAKQISERGSVVTFEGAEKSVEVTNETIQLNEVNNKAAVKHTIVGPDKELSGNMGEAGHIKPSELPECDVLSVDCDGAEVEILKNLDIRPRILNVEHHPVRVALFEEQHERVKELIRDNNYNLIKSENMPYKEGSITIYTAVHNDYPRPEWSE